MTSIISSRINKDSQFADNVPPNFPFNSGSDNSVPF